MKNYLNNPRLTSLCIILLSAAGFFAVGKDPDNDNAGMAMIIIVWIPFILGLISIALYFIVSYFTKEHAWIVGLLAVLLQVFIIVKALA